MFFIIMVYAYWVSWLDSVECFLSFLIRRFLPVISKLTRIKLFSDENDRHRRWFRWVLLNFHRSSLLMILFFRYSDCHRKQNHGHCSKWGIYYDWLLIKGMTHRFFAKLEVFLQLIPVWSRCFQAINSGKEMTLWWWPRPKSIHWIISRNFSMICIIRKGMNFTWTQRVLPTTSRHRKSKWVEPGDQSQ